MINLEKVLRKLLALPNPLFIHLLQRLVKQLDKLSQVHRPSNMIVAFVSIAAATVLCFIMFNSKKTIAHVLKEIKYEFHMQVMGARGITEDHLMRSKNRLEQFPSQKGKVVIITGGARGIGLEIIKTLLENDLTVVMGVRNPEAALKVVQELTKEGLPNNIEVYQLDVSLLKSVEKFVEAIKDKYPKVNYLINNAGIMFVDYKLTEEGYESQFATNYLGHFYLTHLLMPNLRRAGEESETCSRVVNVSSCAHMPGEIFFDDMNMKLDYVTAAAYSQSKLAQIMFARYLNKKLETENAKVQCYSVHPGIVNTDLFKDSPIGKYANWFQKLFFKSPKQGSIPVVYTCLSPRLEDRGGLYVSNCRQGASSSYSKDENFQKKLFEATCDLIKVKEFGVVV